MKFISLSVLLSLFVACTAQSPRQTHYITTHQTTEFQVTYLEEQRLARVDSIISCRHEVTLFVWSPESVFLVDELGDSTVYNMVEMLEPGIYVLADGTNIFTLLHIHKDEKEGSVIYFQKGSMIKRLSTYDQKCDEL